MTLSPIRYALLAAVLSACSSPRTTTLNVAAAADLNFAMQDVVTAFQSRHTATHVQVAYGSSGNFATQIQQGAPFDLFLSADIAYARKLRSDVFTYGVGRIAVWVPANSALDPQSALTDARVKHLAIANPQHAPYGRAAEAALRSMDLWARLQPRLVLGENIAQTMQFVQSGAADAGIVALSLALAPATRDHGRYWEVPLDCYPRMEQGGVILRDSPAAREFRDFLLSDNGRRILKQYGFFLPGE